jgi:ATP-dependent protease Clp ATPase subunit
MPVDKIACSFCGRDQYETLHLIENNDVYICRDCIVKSVDLLTRNKTRQPGGSSVKNTYLASELELECAFCVRKLPDVRVATSINEAKNYICDECVMICFNIILGKLFGDRRPSNDSLYYLFNR